MSLGKALNRIPPSSWGRQVAGPSSLPVVVAQSDERHANRAWAHTHNLKQNDSSRSGERIWTWHVSIKCRSRNLEVAGSTTARVRSCHRILMRKTFYDNCSWIPALMAFDIICTCTDGTTGNFTVFYNRDCPVPGGCNVLLVQLTMQLRPAFKLSLPQWHP